MAFENIRSHIEKRKDKDSDKIIIKEVDDTSAAASLPLAGYQSISSDSSFRKSQMKSNTDNQPIEYTFNTVTDEDTGKTLKFRKPKSSDKDEPEKEPKEYFVLQISPNRMSASIMIFKNDDHDYTCNEIIKYLNDKNIVYGIDLEQIDNIIKNECYYEDIIIAKGTPPVDGKDGYYEYAFNTNPETKPIILPDGSVDYNTLGKYELVYKDQLLATYHPLIEGKDGKNIMGETLKAYEPKDLKPLNLKNVDYDSSTLEYYSVIEGKVTLNNNLIAITPIFIVDGNLEAATGDVDFHGDVLVKGNVFSNVTIKTTGNITINGHVEVATLIAGKDILLKNGMQGSGAGLIKCGGNIMAKFLEQTIVKASGNISTNAILNCETEAGGSITVSGTRGAILGGRASAVEKIEAYSIGNRANVSTKILIGLETDFKSAVNIINERISVAEHNLADAANNLERVSAQMKTSKNPSLSRDKIKFMRDKIRYQSEFNDLNSRKASLSDIRERSINGKVLVHGPVNAGSSITINGITENTRSEYKNVTFTKGPKELYILSNTKDNPKSR